MKIQTDLYFSYKKIFTLIIFHDKKMLPNVQAFNLPKKLYTGVGKSRFTVVHGGEMQ